MGANSMRKHTAKDICKMNYALVEYLEQYINTDTDLDEIDLDEAGAVVDVIKDLSEAEKNYAKARYYETVVYAMGVEDDVERIVNGMRVEEELDPKYVRTANKPEKDAMECLEESLDTIKDIWGSADPSLKQHLKTKLTNLVATMTA